MKPIAFMNGWTEAPSSWRHHLYKKPFQFQKVPGHNGYKGWFSVSVFGFTFFFEYGNGR